MLSGVTGLCGPQAASSAAEIPIDFKEGGNLYRKGANHFENQTPWERFCRAGNPHCTSRWAKPNYDRCDHGYYVSGGAATRGRFGGEYRYCNEGTWGWDYCPPWSRVRLFWWHGRKQQGSGGQFEPNHNNKPFSEEFRAPHQE